MLHDTLWNENAELVRRCREHPFVRRLAAGTLAISASSSSFSKIVSRAFTRLRTRFSWPPVAARLGFPTSESASHGEAFRQKTVPDSFSLPAYKALQFEGTCIAAILSHEYSVPRFDGLKMRYGWKSSR